MPTLSNDMMRAIIMDHSTNPSFKHEPVGDGYDKVHMHSDNCIDDIDVFLKIEGDKVVDACFTGRACAISTSSTDIMCSLIIDKSKEEALHIIDQYNKMIHEEDYDEEVLDEALAFQNTSKQAARIRCATIGWTAAQEMIKKD
ncbi:MAG: SUF system NifU family Fe-S cluster assembly protein [Coprobacillus sp.]|nr:SUF system NifU family Fe-S cluster assembly protein [Coprobacillus sp.]